MARNERRTQLRAIARYLKVVREVVQRGAVEHARWVHFIAESASLMRPANGLVRSPDRVRAHKYAVLFHQYGRFLAAQKPPAYCAPLHDSTAAWLQALELLSGAVSDAIAARDVSEMETLVRGASEAQIRLRTVQRMHGRTLAGLKELFARRPQPTASVPRRGPIWR
jgi:hypothetical protein